MFLDLKKKKRMGKGGSAADGHTFVVTGKEPMCVGGKRPCIDVVEGWKNKEGSETGAQRS